MRTVTATCLALVAIACAAGTAHASLRAAAADAATRVSRHWESPVVPLSSPKDVAALLCGEQHAAECAALFSNDSGDVRRAMAGATKAVAARLAGAIRTAPLLETLVPGLPRSVYDFAKHAHGKIGSTVVAMSSDMDLLAAVDAMRREGAHLQFLGRERTAADDYPYWGFLMRDLGSAGISAAQPTVLSTECFKNVTATAAWTNSSQKAVAVSITFAEQKSFLCTDTLMVGLWGLGAKVISIDTPKTSSFEFPFDITGAAPARHWYVQSRGVRIQRFNKEPLGLILDAVATVTLIAGFAADPVSNATMQANFEFLRNYVEISPRMQPMSQPRAAGRTVVDALNKSYIQSGDSLIVVRYDGLDPVIGWGEGFTGGHSTIAIRSPTNGTLYVCESTTLDAYWPRNGVQCHEFDTWIDLAVKAQFNVLLAPLSPEAAARFNTTAALEFWKENEGLNYGFLNFLFGWLDQRKDNFPCIPPDFEYCLNEGVVETIAIAWDTVAGNSPTNVFRQPLNHRVGTNGLSVEEVMQYGATQYSMDFPAIYTTPEQDSWRYNTTKYGQPAVGRAMVCDVFVCHMWKHGGIFDPINRDINCGEQTLWDIYSMQLFDAAKLGANRPAPCVAADPDNQLCQLVGVHTFNAKPDFNTRALYKLMGQNCSSLSPNYIRAPGC